ncbi:hypothetical protein GL50803_0014471 [Giardia duodenalis]|uniref:Uncharacterized protein n=1 Tax=Giardia intestinalis (strain ATCC 50803 / WB clone C6) TaxID=184922 RepID=A8BL01_GIAIC|nr:hypothetical protein GL50803_0014471 [Giardia intestinalis]KAE8301595.1 hypothetical protein GL50803_0014471 [Giardia intestinalis]|eukprot:XP_001706390.1 Hypothetical protein GL50803_14471 [Giardia lamblia ATCC 50803]
MPSHRTLPGSLLEANTRATGVIKDQRALPAYSTGHKEDPLNHPNQLLISSMCIPQVNTLNEALTSTMPANLILRIRSSVGLIPTLYNEYKTEFDAFAQTLVANLERIPTLPVYCKVAGSFKKRGIVKVLQRLIVDGYIEPISITREQIKTWPVAHSNVYSALPDILNRLLRPGLLSRATTQSLSEVEGEEIMKRSIALTCYQLKQVTNKKEAPANIIVEKQSISTTSNTNPVTQKTLELEEIEHHFMDLDNEHAGYSAIPMDMCPFDDSVASSDESNTAEPPLKAYSNIEHFYSDVFGPLEKHPSSEGQQKKICTRDEASSHTEVSTPLLSISSSVSEETIAAYVIPVFKNCPYFRRYPSVKFYREFIRELYASLCKARQRKCPSVVAVPPEVLEKLVASYNCKNKEKLIGKKKKITKIADVRLALEGYIGRGKKGNAFYNIQPEIKVNERCYIYRSELLQMVSTYQTAPPLMGMLGHYCGAQTMTAYMQRISTVFELPREEVIILGIESFSCPRTAQDDENWAGFCCIHVQKVSDEATATIPYLPIGVSRVGSFIVTSDQAANITLEEIYPGTAVRSPVARYDASLGGMQLTLLQSTVVNVRQNSLVIVGMDIRDSITDAPSSRRHNLLNVPRDGEILCHSANIFMRSRWDVFMASNSEDGIMLPQRLCAKSVCDVQTNKNVYMTDYLYNKRLRKTKLFRTLDCTVHELLGQKFQLMQLESAREALCKAKIQDANEVVVCENSLFILSALMIHPALICLLEADDRRNVQTIYGLASDSSIYTNPKKLEIEVRNIFKRYEAEQENLPPGSAQALAYDAIRTYFLDLMILYAL